ncbi:MAG: 1-acyl-sn-glycerol-3-phosphate acyltransferase, partial [Acidobacteriota bacterium]|nr:1-acyl-sn-glycerol-3-phosphate acyltransferase [Acidobacteriota bacterium]
APAIVLLTVGMGSLSLICSIWDRTGHTQHRLAQTWSRMLLALAFAKCTVRGLEKIDPAKSHVLVANHSSYMDIPAIMGNIPLQFRFYAKKGLFSIPFLGWHLDRAGHLPVVRGDARASLKSMSEGARVVREQGISLLLFPEGGRTEHNMRPFREGAAHIAIKTGVPVVPIGLSGARGVLPMHSLLLRGGTIEVNIGDPISTEGMTSRDRGRLNEMLQEQVAALAHEKVVEPVAS